MGVLCLWLCRRQPTSHVQIDVIKFESKLVPSCDHASSVFTCRVGLRQYCHYLQTDNCIREMSAVISQCYSLQIVTKARSWPRELHGVL
jgi:hypothetical protein